MQFITPSPARITESSSLNFDKITTETYVKSFSANLMKEQVSFYDYGPASRCF